MFKWWVMRKGQFAIYLPLTPFYLNRLEAQHSGHKDETRHTVDYRPPIMDMSKSSGDEAGEIGVSRERSGHHKDVTSVSRNRSGSQG